MRLISNEEMAMVSGSNTVTVTARRMTDEEKAEYDRELQAIIDQCMEQASRVGGAFFSYNTKISAEACDLGAGNISAKATMACGVIYDQKVLLEKNDGDGRLTSCQIQANAKMSVPRTTHGGPITSAN